ncbi:hypothetical protein HpMS107_34330 [Helicobacter pylori]|uniref:hypothetical protein n=1 Tax=Cupriavidus TaxID=106589 RepID=UPI0004672F6E|nr:MULTISPECIES: hypothetical protein [Cupriavidus]
MKFHVLALVAFIAVPQLALAQTCQRIGNQTYCSNGMSAQQIGNQTYYSDGTTSQRIGNQTYYSNGTTAQQIGNQTDLAPVPRIP